MYNVLPKMKPLWIGPFTILLVNYNRNKYSWDISGVPSVHLYTTAVILAKSNLT